MSYKPVYSMLREVVLHNDISNMSLFPCTLFAWKVVRPYNKCLFDKRQFDSTVLLLITDSLFTVLQHRGVVLC